MGREGSEGRADSLAEHQKREEDRLAAHNERQARLGRPAAEGREDQEERRARLGRAPEAPNEEPKEEKPKAKRSRSTAKK